MSRSLAAPARLAFPGTSGTFSRAILDALLDAGQNVAAIVTPGEAWHPRPPPPSLEFGLPVQGSYVEQTIVQSGWRHNVPVWSVGAWDEVSYSTLRSLALDAVVVACWPSRLPDTLLDLPRSGCLNVHPSLLPEFRGPALLFWQLRAGLRASGVTVHRMSSRLDEGEILGQAPFVLEPGASGPELDLAAALAGAEVLLSVLSGLAAGTVRPQTQAAGGSYQSWPGEGGFHVPTTWTALHAWNFMRGVEEWGIPFTLLLPEGKLMVERALRIWPDGTLASPTREGDEGLSVRFTQGIVEVTPPMEPGDSVRPNAGWTSAQAGA